MAEASPAGISGEGPEGSVSGSDAPEGAVRPRTPRIAFSRGEFAGAFGDLGTDLPLLLAMIPAAGLDGASVFIVFGLAQVATGVAYGLPMPMQPLKAMAALVIAGGIPARTLAGGGVAIGLMMVVLTMSGLLGWLGRLIPRAVVRGVQLGLGLTLASLALRSYVPSMGAEGWVLACAVFAVGVLLWGSRRVPAALVIVGIGAVYGGVVQLDVEAFGAVWGPAMVEPTAIGLEDLWVGLVVLALPQLPLSLSNSVFATAQTARDLFPERAVSVRKLGMTYGLVNVVAPLLGGVPMCHGCGGLAGHHAFGARTGGSVVIYGTALVLVGVLAGDGAAVLIGAFPKPVLGVMLVFEAVALMSLLGDVASRRRDLVVALLTGVVCAGVPSGFLVGLVVGTCVFYADERWGVLSRRGE